jgi:hypothetical protein
MPDREDWNWNVEDERQGRRRHRDRPSSSGAVARRETGRVRETSNDHPSKPQVILVGSFGPHHDYHEYNADGKLGSSACRASSARSQSSCSGRLSAPTQAARHTSLTWTCPWRRASATPSSGRMWEQTARPIPGRCTRADHRPRVTESWLSMSGFATASSRRARRSRGSCERKART